MKARGAALLVTLVALSFSGMSVAKQQESLGFLVGVSFVTQVGNERK